MDPEFVVKVLEKLKRSGLTSREEVEALKYAVICVRLAAKLAPGLDKIIKEVSEGIDVDNEFDMASSV